MPHHTRHLDAKQALLDSIENGITAMLQPVLEATLQKTVELVEDETVEREAALTQLNDTLQSPIGDVVFLRQHEIAEMAVQYHPGIPHRLLTPMEWHDTIFTSGFTLAQWFQRKSPSRWMCDILKATPAKIRHHQNRHRNGCVACCRNHGGVQLEQHPTDDVDHPPRVIRNWNMQRLRFFGRP